MTYFNWDYLQPQNPTTDHYIILRKSTSYKWHDVPSEKPDLRCTLYVRSNLTNTFEIVYLLEIRLY